MNPDWTVEVELDENGQRYVAANRNGWLYRVAALPLAPGIAKHHGGPVMVCVSSPWRINYPMQPGGTSQKH